MRVFIAGDSLFQYNDCTTYPQTGIGQMLPLFFRGGEGLFVNRAKNGRSTKSFIAEGRLDHIEAALKSNDVLIVSFGHNDEKREDPLRGTEPFGDFQKNLSLFAAAAVGKGALPLFITSAARRTPGSHGRYPEAMRDFARDGGFPCIDLCSLSESLVASLDYAASRSLYMHFDAGLYARYPQGRADDTHLRPDGAYLFASLIAQELVRLAQADPDRNELSSLASLLVPLPPPEG